MFSVTPAAREQIEAYFKQNDIKPVRVFLTSGCGGSQLALALDGKRPSDATYACGDFEFIIEQGLLSRAQPMEIDFGPRGFIINSTLELQSGCGCCGSSDSCCG